MLNLKDIEISRNQPPPQLKEIYCNQYSKSLKFYQIAYSVV